MAGLAAPVTAGIVGHPHRRRDLRGHLERRLPGITYLEADAAWEHLTLNEVRRWAQRQDSECAVLYAHTKGAYHGDEINTPWRQSMTRHLVGGWRQCVELLSDYDAVGCHWLTPQEWPGAVTSPFFGGNFWWARASYLAGLPPLESDNRHDAEIWIGLGAPRVHDLMPGWPSLEMFIEGMSA